MNLTRYILFEKAYPLRQYNHPSELPEYLWLYADSIINQNYKNTTASLRLYLEVILVPMGNITKFHVSKKYNISNNKWHYKITCDAFTFRIDLKNNNPIDIQSLTNHIWWWHNEELNLKMFEGYKFTNFLNLTSNLSNCII